MRRVFRQTNRAQARGPLAQLRLPETVKTNVESGTPYVYVNEWITEKNLDRFVKSADNPVGSYIV